MECPNSEGGGKDAAVGRKPKNEKETK